MSDRDNEREARNLLAPSLHGALGAVSTGMLTGYLVVMEYMDDDGDFQIHWLTGSGAQAEEGQEQGLPHHRVYGLVRRVEEDVSFHYWQAKQ